MSGDFGEDAKYYATSIDHDEYRNPLVRAIAKGNPLLPVIERMASHICALQDKINDCAGPCMCACDYDDPGDVCMPHSRAKAALMDDTDV